jgi:hypothetical protein
MDLTILKKTFIEKIINSCFFIIVELFIVNNIFVTLGMSQSFGAFQFASMIVILPIFHVFAEVINLISDIENDRIINYRLLLPMKSFFVFLSKYIYFVIMYFSFSIVVFPLGKICCYNTLNTTSIHYGMLFSTFLFSSLFYLSLTFFLASFIKNVSSLETIWGRFIYPMWILGGFQFSWYILHKSMPLFAYVDLLNPMIYITEGSRNAIITHNTTFINPYICFLV